MPTLTNLLSRGNGKLGEGIHSWSLPAVETCPGRSTLCESVCYARTGRFRTQIIQDRLQASLDASLRDDFERRIVAEIRRRGVHTLRIHVAGDFYSPEYAAKWLRIARQCRRTRFYCYTRSWRQSEFAAVLADLATLSNVRLWWSVDAETGLPTDMPERVELAYLQREVTDDPHDAKVVFRVKHLRKTPARRIGLAIVCSTETGLPQADDITCTSCRRCFR
jgi:Gene product 88